MFYLFDIINCIFIIANVVDLLAHHQQLRHLCVSNAEQRISGSSVGVVDGGGMASVAIKVD
jgi:hypothetical protein